LEGDEEGRAVGIEEGILDGDEGVAVGEYVGLGNT